MSAWEKVARHCEREYGDVVDWDERYFICGECGEPIYECDWDSAEFYNEDGQYICPVCEVEL